MPDPKLEDVFKSSGIPTYTFVHSVDFDRLVSSLPQTAGSVVVVEGPAGIGKTTAVSRALDQIGVPGELKWFDGKARLDSYLIADRSAWPSPGTVVIDNFHWLSTCIQKIFVKQVESLTEGEQIGSTLILTGGTGTGDLLRDYASVADLQVDIIKFGPNPDDRISELVEQGERALNIRLNMKPYVIAAAGGNFCLAQILCFQACLSAGITQAQARLAEVAINPEDVVCRLLGDATNRFRRAAIKFATGPRLRREGRAVYLRLLKWLAEADGCEICLREQIARHPEYRGSIGQLIERGHLRRFLDRNPDLRAMLRYDPYTATLAAEDPRFEFLLRNLNWSQVAEEIGFGDSDLRLRRRYDFALSFVESEKSWAERLFELLSESELEVSCDHDQQAPPPTADLGSYLAAIGAPEARHIVVLLGPGYPAHMWKWFESDQFKRQFEADAVIPIWFLGSPISELDKRKAAENITFDPQRDSERQLQEIAELLRNRIAEDRAPAVVAV